LLFFFCPLSRVVVRIESSSAEVVYALYRTIRQSFGDFAPASLHIIFQFFGSKRTHIDKLLLCKIILQRILAQWIHDLLYFINYKFSLYELILILFMIIPFALIHWNDLILTFVKLHLFLLLLLPIGFLRLLLILILNLIFDLLYLIFLWFCYSSFSILFYFFALFTFFFIMFTYLFCFLLTTAIFWWLCCFRWAIVFN